MTGKGYMIFSAPALISLYENLVYGTEVDFTIVIVAIVTSLVGSTMQITHKNLDQKRKNEPIISKFEVYAIYITGVVFGILAYYVGHEKSSLLYTMLIGIFGSYMSLDLFKYGKAAVITLIQKLPDALLQYWFNQKSNSNDKDNK